MAQVIKDELLQKVTYYITDTIKQVVENGHEFKAEHFFMIMETLDPKEVQESLIILTLKIIIEEIDITTVEYIEFTQKIKDVKLKQAYFDIRTKLFPEDE